MDRRSRYHVDLQHRHATAVGDAEALAAARAFDEFGSRLKDCASREGRGQQIDFSLLGSRHFGLTADEPSQV